MAAATRAEEPRVGRFLLVVLLTGAALAAGAWLGGWRPPTERLSAGLSTGMVTVGPARRIARPSGARSTKILRERGSATDNWTRFQNEPRARG